MKKIYLLIALTIAHFGNAQNVSTVAGNGNIGSTNGNGTNALFGAPHDVAVNSVGEIFVTDVSNHRIRKIATNGDVTDFAGSTQGFVDGTGTNAQFNSPVGICINSSDELFVTDYSNNRIRKITAAGVVTTLAGNGTPGTNDGNGTNASLNGPAGICINQFGQIFWAEQISNIIRVLMPNGDVFTVAGSGIQGFADGQNVSAQFNMPYDVAVDGLNNLYVADQNNYRIRLITPLGNVTTFAGNGTNAVVSGNGTSASFYVPWGITYDPISGNLYTVGAGDVIQQITASADVTTIAGFSYSAQFIDGPALSARFLDPTGIAMGLNGEIIIADYYNRRVRKMSSTNSLDQLFEQDLISIYPNPAEDFITVETAENIQQMSILNIHGTLVQTAATKTFSIADLPNGIYFLTISTDKGTAQRKFIKQ